MLPRELWLVKPRHSGEIFRLALGTSSSCKDHATKCDAEGRKLDRLLALVHAISETTGGERLGKKQRQFGMKNSSRVSNRFQLIIAARSVCAFLTQARANALRISQDQSAPASATDQSIQRNRFEKRKT